VTDGRCTTVDVDSLQAEARLAARSLIERSGIQPRSLWPLR